MQPDAVEDLDDSTHLGDPGHAHVAHYFGHCAEEQPGHLYVSRAQYVTLSAFMMTCDFISPEDKL